jgi:hypothetical protein
LQAWLVDMHRVDLGGRQPEREEREPGDAFELATAADASVAEAPDQRSRPGLFAGAGNQFLARIGVVPRHEHDDEIGRGIAFLQHVTEDLIERPLPGGVRGDSGSGPGPMSSRWTGHERTGWLLHTANARP